MGADRFPPARNGLSRDSGGCHARKSEDLRACSQTVTIDSGQSLLALLPGILWVSQN